mmetsp:Transcript_160839/g.516227  ORF Transcript_160839/g.516227 Transcript_160839/m.516227 type:complete len:263 (+) Transcript_160839:348-1136(+)
MRPADAEAVVPCQPTGGTEGHTTQQGAEEHETDAVKQHASLDRGRILHEAHKLRATRAHEPMHGLGFDDGFPELLGVAIWAGITAVQHHDTIAGIPLSGVVARKPACALATVDADGPIVHTQEACPCDVGAEDGGHAVEVRVLVPCCPHRIHSRLVVGGARLVVPEREHCKVRPRHGRRGGGRDAAPEAGLRPPVLPPEGAVAVLAGEDATAHRSEAQQTCNQQRNRASSSALVPNEEHAQACQTNQTRQHDRRRARVVYED